MRKILIATLLGMALLVTSLSGCGADKPGKSDSSTEVKNSSVSDAKGKEAETADETEELVEIVWQWPGTPGEGLQEVEDALNEMTEKDIGVHVTLYPMLDYDTQLALDVGTGIQIDLCVSIGSDAFYSKINDGLIIPLDDYLEYTADIKEDCKDTYNAGQYKGIYYGFPLAYYCSNGYGITVEKEVADKYGIMVKEEEVDLYVNRTIEEIEEWFATVKAGEGEKYYPFAPDVYTAIPLFSAYGEIDTLAGGSVASGVLLLHESFENTTIENLFASDLYEEYAYRMYDWAQKGYISKDASANTTGKNELVGAGTHWSFPTWVGSDNIRLAYSWINGKDAYSFSMIEPYKRSSELLNVVWSVPASSGNPAKAVETLNYIYKNDAAAHLLQFGIEGRDYEILKTEVGSDGKNYSQFKFMSDDPSSLPYYQPLGIYGDRFSWPVTHGDPALEADWRLLEEGYNASPAMGYVFIKDGVEEKIGAINSVISQYVPTINCGAANPAVILPEFIDALKKAGIDEVIAENQRQFDEWLALQ